MDAIKIVQSAANYCFEKISVTLSRIDTKIKWIAISVFSLIALCYVVRRCLKPSKFKVLNGEKIPLKRFISKEDLKGDTLRLSNGVRIPGCDLREKTLPDNQTRLIGIFNEAFTGKGEKHSKSGAVYAGELKEGKADGLGCLKINNQYRLEGPFEKDALISGRLVVKEGEDERSISSVESVDQLVRVAGVEKRWLGWFTEQRDGYGSLIAPTITLNGEFKAGFIQNGGKAYFDEHVYTGEFQSNQPHGQGTLQTSYGAQIVGDFGHGNCLGGTATLSSGRICQVEYREEGRDTLFITGLLDKDLNGVGHISDQETTFNIDGELQGGKLNGNGVYQSAQGYKIKGLFKENLLVNGKVILSDGTQIPDCKYIEETRIGSQGLKVIGTFDAKLSGIGIISSPNAIYEGEFKEGRLVKGVVRVPSGMKIQTTSDSKHFEVTLSNTQLLTGCQWKNEQIAAGVLIASIEGIFDDHFNGVGKVTHCNGIVAYGEFIDGDLNGLGELVSVNGKSTFGIFERNECIKEDQDSQKYLPFRNLLVPS